MDFEDVLTLLVVVVIVGCVVLGVASIFIAHIALFPAHGQAYGYIYYQEKGGLFNLDSVCWKDTPYSESCETFNPDGKTYQAGRYSMNYSCRRFVWAWEAPSECTIVNATRLADIPQQ